MDTSQKAKGSTLSKKLQKLLDLVTEAEEPKAPLPRKQTRKKVIKKKVDHTHLTRFIRQANIVSGNIKVDNYIIWYIYLKVWSISRKEILYTKHEFFRQLAKQFTKGRYNRRRYYLLNMEVSSDVKEKAKAYLEEERANQSCGYWQKTELKYARTTKKIPILKPQKKHKA